jgi:hypothetical protein
VNVTLVGVGGGGLGGLGFDILTDGVVTGSVGVNWSSMQYFGNAGASGVSELWGDFGNGPTDGVFNQILTFTVSGASAGSSITLGELSPGSGNFGAYDDSFNSIAGTITVNGYTVPVPEPTTAALLGFGLIGLAVGGRRR